MIQIVLTMKKLAVVPLAPRTTIDSTVAEMHLLQINTKLILNTSLKNTNLVPITWIKHLHDAYLLRTLRNPTNKKDKQTKSHKKLKHVHFSPIIYFKLVIPVGKKDRKHKNRMVKCLVDSGASEFIITKEKAEKLPVKSTTQEKQWQTAAGVLTTNTKTATSFSFPELHTNKLFNQSLNIVERNIDC